jgi:hypothetical protein
MKIDKQGKTQKKQSKKNYRKTQKAGGLDFGIGKSHRGEVENIIHQLHKIIKYKEDKDTTKTNTHTDRFNDAFKSLDAKVKGYIMNIVNETKDEDNQQGFTIIEGEGFATTELLKIIHGEMKRKIDTKKIDRRMASRIMPKFDSAKNHIFTYVDDFHEFSSDPDPESIPIGTTQDKPINNRKLITDTINNQYVRDVILDAAAADKLKPEPEPGFLSKLFRRKNNKKVVPTALAVQSAQGGKKTQKKRKRKRNKRKTASKK